MESYRQVRDKIETWDVFFTASNSIFSRLIRLFTQSKVSHVGIFVWLDKRLFCAECLEGKGCVFTPASNRLKWKIWIGNCSPKVEKNIIREKVIGSVGKVKYDLLGAILSLLWDTHTAKKFCSEFVSDILELKFDALDRGITPLDVANRCSELQLIKN